MNNNKILTVCIAALFSTMTSFATANDIGVTEKLFSHLFNKNLKQNLFQAKDLPWMAGSYSIVISRRGDANISSAQKNMTIAVPLQINIVGNINQDLGFAKVALDCKSQFDNTGELQLTPSFAEGEVHFGSELTLPIPFVEADCGNMRFPITEFLKKLVEHNKPGWEQQINETLGKQFNSEKAQTTSS